MRPVIRWLFRHLPPNILAEEYAKARIDRAAAEGVHTMISYTDAEVAKLQVGLAGLERMQYDAAVMLVRFPAARHLILAVLKQRMRSLVRLINEAGGPDLTEEAPRQEAA